MHEAASMKERMPNCWEFKNCGRQPGGPLAKDGRACVASVEKRTDGVNSGKNGGRACWAIAGTECGGKPQGAFAQKLETCQSCLFYLLVMEEEYPNYASTKRILPMLR
jgi:hypothetical protein